MSRAMRDLRRHQRVANQAKQVVKDMDFEETGIDVLPYRARATDEFWALWNGANAPGQKSIAEQYNYGIDWNRKRSIKIFGVNLRKIGGVWFIYVNKISALADMIRAQ